MFSEEDDFDMDDKFWEEQLQEEKLQASKPLCGVKRKSFELDLGVHALANNKSDPLGLNSLLHKKSRCEIKDSDGQKLSRKCVETNIIGITEPDEDSDLNDNLLYSALDSLEESITTENLKEKETLSFGKEHVTTTLPVVSTDSTYSLSRKQIAEEEASIQEKLPKSQGTSTLQEVPDDMLGIHNEKTRGLFDLQLSPTSFDSEIDLSLNVSPSWKPTVSSLKSSSHTLKGNKSDLDNTNVPKMSPLVLENKTGTSRQIASSIENSENVQSHTESVWYKQTGKAPSIRADSEFESCVSHVSDLNNVSETERCELSRGGQNSTHLKQLRQIPVNLASVISTALSIDGNMGSSSSGSGLRQSESMDVQGMETETASGIYTKTVTMSKSNDGNRLDGNMTTNLLVAKQTKQNVITEDFNFKTPSRDSNVMNYTTPQTMRKDTSHTANSSRHTPSTPASSRVSAGKRKRKFPGPAGVLPKLKDGLELTGMSNLKPASPAVSLKKELKDPCDLIASSQSCEDRFLEDQWLAMKTDLESRADDIIHKYCLAEVIKLASKKQLPRGKVPIVCAVIEQISTLSADASVLLRDPSGLMKGTIHRQLVKDYPTQLVIGTVLVLRQCGVFSPTVRSHYLNITANNVVCIYSRQSDGQLCAQRLSHFVTEDFVIPEPFIPPSKPTAAYNSATSVGLGTVPPSIRQPLFSTTQPMGSPVYRARTPGVPVSFNSIGSRNGSPGYQFKTPTNTRSISVHGQVPFNTSTVAAQQYPRQTYRGTPNSTPYNSVGTSAVGINSSINQYSMRLPRLVPSSSSVGPSTNASCSGRSLNSSPNCRIELMQNNATGGSMLSSGNDGVYNRALRNQTNSPLVPLNNGNNVKTSVQTETPNNLQKKFSFKKTPPEKNIHKTVFKSAAKTDSGVCENKTALDFSMHDENLDDLLTGMEDELFTDM